MVVAKVKKTSVPTTTFAQAFKVRSSKLFSMGCFNPTLAIDTNLAIDPLLLKKSSQDEFSKAAHLAFEKRFQDLAHLLSASTSKGDAPWRAAEKLFVFPEISGTCLGLGKASYHGHGIGVALRARLIETAKEMVMLGATNPAVLPLLALLEKDVGMDLISDMTTNIAIDALVAFTQRICRELNIPTKQHYIKSIRKSFDLPSNPLAQDAPVILVAHDVLREIPIALDFYGIRDCSDKNQALRDDVNANISRLLSIVLDKKALREQALASRKALATLLEAVTATAAVSASTTPFPWAEIAAQFVEQYPLDRTIIKTLAPDEVVVKIVEQFRHLVEAEGLNKSLWNSDDQPRHEHDAQRLFYAIAQSYCKANDLDVTPEADHGRGPMDFKFSAGFEKRIVVELKLSSNKKVVDGFTKQLKIYEDSATTNEGVYVVLDVGTGGTWRERLVKLRNEQLSLGKASRLEFIDATPKSSASKA